MKTTITTHDPRGNATEHAVSKRAGQWALIKGRYGYSVFHVPENGDAPKSIPPGAFRKEEGGTHGLHMGLSYRAGLAILKEVSAAFPTFTQDHESIRALKDWAAARKEGAR